MGVKRLGAPLTQAFDFKLNLDVLNNLNPSHVW